MSQIDHAPNSEAMRRALGIYHQETSERPTVNINHHKSVAIDDLTIADLKLIRAKTKIIVKEFVFGKIEEAEYVFNRVGGDWATIFRTRGWKTSKKVGWADIEAYFLKNSDRQIVKIDLPPKPTKRSHTPEFAASIWVRTDDFERFKAFRDRNGYKTHHETFAAILDIAEAFEKPSEPSKAS